MQNDPVQNDPVQDGPIQDGPVHDDATWPPDADVPGRFGEEWTAEPDGIGGPRLESLRERKKRQTRQLISDTATALFLERGFDDVRISEVAEACGISEKTVYNYFPTKESLMLDREEAMTAAIRRALGPGAPSRISPIEAAVQLIEADLDRLDDEWSGDPALDVTLVHRFHDLIETTPSLRAAQRDMTDRLVQVAAEAMASRAGVDPGDPEPQIAANAILGLWRVQFAAIRRLSDGSIPPSAIKEQVIAEVRRAARLIDTGLWSFGLAVQGSSGRDQLKAAADAANEARKQVLTAIRQARDAWHQVKAEAQGGEADPDPDTRDLRRLARQDRRGRQRR
ncbi:MAG: TetR/AcrR family transcriptional regulator [Acidimicrobiaceae bacterium]|nr:TetR/AcrR family transcriptional regulator [Acidimicrobiaceae bacterium]